MKNLLQKTVYGTVVASKVPFEATVDRAKALLAEEGFGVVSDIDVSKTLREKLGITFRPYRILGACNPAIAYEALSRDGQIGLLLPCNVVVQEEAGHTIVSAIDAVAMMRVAKDSALLPLAKDAGERLTRAIERLAETA
jgi:uncharacterized protein (DUF302 family)